MLILIKIQAKVEEGENFKVVLDTLGGFERDICNGVYPNKVAGIFQGECQDNVYHYHQLDSLPERVQLFVT